MQPYLLYSDGKGSIFEDTSLYVVGRTGWDAVPVEEEAWIELPEGGNLYELPGRRGIGIDVRTGEMRLCDKGWAVAAFIPPAHTGFYLSAFETAPEAPTLPLFCYTAAGWHNGLFYVPARRIERDIRQEASGYDESLVASGIETLTATYPHNRLVQHLAHTCAEKYECPAARNYFLHRWECPIPSSPACNSNCVGCISFQPEEESITSPHDRISFKPTALEIAEYTVPHLETAPYPIVSFGQGCEGEPLLMGPVLEESIREIRKHTSRGSININTNGSKPDVVERLMQAGLNSIRVSTNSLQPALYTSYYRPNNYVFENIIKSLEVVNRMGGWTSINYFVFPGVTDSVAEYEALRAVIQRTGLNMIQWRNFNIDPDWYMGRMGITDPGEILGMGQLMDVLQEEFPNLKYGYFNPPLERMTDYDHAFAH
ncbi:MAG: radical SAM protein [Sphingobacteriales bacterium]|nr:MAG: radical SAM protein [Sphingobacteriales bacterium]